MFKSVFLFAVAAMAATSANAAVTVYTSQAAYDAALGGTITTENFSSTTLVSGLSYTSTNGSISGGVFNDDVEYTTATTTFDFSPATKGFGATFDESPNGYGSGIAFFINGTSFVTNLVNAGPGTFLGFISTTPFTSVQLASPGGSGLEHYNLDNLQFGPGSSAVPESTTWAMMLSGFAIIGAGLRKRTRRVTVSYS